METSIIETTCHGVLIAATECTTNAEALKALKDTYKHFKKCKGTSFKKNVFYWDNLTNQISKDPEQTRQKCKDNPKISYGHRKEN